MKPFRPILLSFFLFYLNLEHFIILLCSLFSRTTKNKNILIFKTDAIGDAIIWLDSAKEYKKHFPDYELTLLCNQNWLEIAEKLPYFDKIITINKDRFLRSPKYRFLTLIKLSRVSYDKIINPIYSRDYFVTDALIRNLKAKEKIGSTGNYENTDNSLSSFTSHYQKRSLKLKLKADKFYTKLIDANPQSLMELNRNSEFIRNYIDPGFQSQLPKIPFKIEPFEKLKAKKYVVLFLGAGTLRRVWPIENYATVIHAISMDFDIVLSGGKDEITLYQAFEEKILSNTDRKVFNFIGKTTLPELISIISGASFIISNETSASHIAVAVGVPSVCILSGAHFGRFLPYAPEKITAKERRFLPKIANHYMACYYCNHHCIYIQDKITTYPCIIKISPEVVVEKIIEIQNTLS